MAHSKDQKGNDPEPPYISISHKKQSQLNDALYLQPSWKDKLQLPPQILPPGMHLSIPDSVFHASAKLHGRVSVIDVPRTCGLLSSRELEITEKWDVKGLLDVMRRGELKVEEVVTSFLKRATIIHQLTRCLTEPLFHSALQRAKELDDHFQRTGTTVGPLHGLPVSVKDTFNVKGVDSSIGIAALAFRPATENAALVDLLTFLGAVVIAKTNVPQTLGALDSCNHLFGRTLNPLDHRLTAGGSTGGEGVLISMRGSMVGFGTDIGGSIRIPAMCNGIYGFKPSAGRVPFGGQEDGQAPGKSRMTLQAVAGPLARSVDDLGAVLQEIVPRAELFGEDCIPGRWESETTASQSGSEHKNFTVGILRSDGLVEPLPPIAKILDEVAHILRQTPGIDVIDLPSPPALAKCQSLAGKLMGVDDGSTMSNLLQATGEPLTPWLRGRMSLKPRKPLTVAQLAALQAQRTAIEKEMLKMWCYEPSNPNTGNGSRRRIDAVILPVAPHPVPEIDRYNAVGYTSSFVLLDYPSGVIPVRRFGESDLELGKEMATPTIGSWDKANRELWNEKSVDRRVYLDSPLSIQVVTPKLHDYDLFQSMQIIDRAIRDHQALDLKKPTSAKL